MKTWSRYKDLLESIYGEREDMVEHMAMLWVDHMLESLDERERDVLVKRFGLGEEPCTLDAIAAHVPKLHGEGCVSRERVRMIEAKALRELREFGIREGNKDPSIHDIGLPARAQTALMKTGVTTVSQLTEMRPSELLRFKNFGYVTLKGVENVLAEMGMELSK